MGLDMWLYKKSYVKNSDYMKPEEKYDISIKKNGKDVEHINKDNIAYITEEIGYWRKFNALHNYIVANHQDGVDDCRDTYLTKNDLEKLLNILLEIQKDHNKADALLPTTPGFFFGGTEYGDYYFNQIDYTVELLSKYTSVDNSNCEFTYSSSW